MDSPVRLARMAVPTILVKICGLRTEAAIDAAVAAGADAVGFVIAEGRRDVVSGSAQLRRG